MEAIGIDFDDIVHLKISMYPTGRIWDMSESSLLVLDINAWLMLHAYKRQERVFK